MTNISSARCSVRDEKVSDLDCSHCKPPQYCHYQQEPRYAALLISVMMKPVSVTNQTQRGIRMSLQEQLLKAGLIDNKKASKIKKSKYKQAQQKQKNKIETADGAKLAAQQVQAKKLKRDRQLNQQRKAEAERKAIAAQVRQLIEMNRLHGDVGDIAYNFTDGTTVKHIHVTAPQLKQLGTGRLCIVKLDERYELIPTLVAEKIQLRDDSIRILSNQPTETPAGDDPYADFQVPDDLMW